MEEWKEYKYTDLCTLIGGGTPKTSEPSYWNGDIPWLSVKDFGNGDKYVYTTEKSITKDGLENSSTKLLQKDDIIISARGTVGAMAMLAKEMAFNQSCFGIRSNGIVNQHFLYYLTKTKIFELQKFSHGAVFDTITRETFANLSCKIPPIEKQIKIASILSTLDDKIEVNRRINDNFIYQKLLEIISIWKITTLLNDNLEQQAQALFKSWFVDFEPFKDGEFVESELGMIPKGWRVGKLGELCQFKRGKNLLSKDAKFGDVPVVAGGLEPSCYHNISNTKSPVVTVSGSGANAGFMRMYYQEVWASDCSFIDTSCENLLFVYYFLSINRRLLKHAQTGAVQPYVKPADIHDFNIVIPPYNEIKIFQTKVSPIVINNGKNEQESKKLILLRDTLLPHLMSGELKVNDVTI